MSVVKVHVDTERKVTVHYRVQGPEAGSWGRNPIVAYHTDAFDRLARMLTEDWRVGGLRLEVVAVPAESVKKHDGLWEHWEETLELY